ncbi:hypothetical protein V7794_22800 [Rhizobium laguerreae]
MCSLLALTRFVPFSYFLQLLERDAEVFGDLHLAHLAEQAQAANVGADLNIDGFWCVGHGKFS